MGTQPLLRPINNVADRREKKYSGKKNRLLMHVNGTSILRFVFILNDQP